MKLTYQQFAFHLKKELAPIYLISGDDWQLKQDALSWLRKAAKTAQFSERTRLSSDTIDAQMLCNWLNTGSLLAEKRLLELDLRYSKLDKHSASLLQSYIEQPNPNQLLCIETYKPDDKMMRSGWYQSVMKQGVVVTIWPLTKEKLTKWIHDRTKHYPYVLTDEAAQILAEYSLGNVAAAAQAIEKIHLLQPANLVTPDVVDLVMNDASRLTVFHFVDCFLAEDAAMSLKILRQLQAEGTEPVLILWSITRELRSLIEMAELLNQGVACSVIFQKHRVFANRHAVIRSFLDRHSLDDCYQYITKATEIDQMIKGANNFDPWQALEFFCLRVKKDNGLPPRST